MATRGKKKNVPESAEIGNDANGVVTIETIQIIFPEIKQPRKLEYKNWQLISPKTMKSYLIIQRSY